MNSGHPVGHKEPEHTFAQRGNDQSLYAKTYGYVVIFSFNLCQITIPRNTCQASIRSHIIRADLQILFRADYIGTFSISVTLIAFQGVVDRSNCSKISSDFRVLKFIDQSLYVFSKCHVEISGRVISFLSTPR